MGRRRTQYANQRRTTWSISFEIDDLMRKHKGRRESIEEFLDRVFSQWLESNNDNSNINTIEKFQNAIEIYQDEISKLLNVLIEDNNNSKLEYYIQRLTILRDKGPLALQKMDDDKLKTGVSQTILFKQIFS